MRFIYAEKENNDQTEQGIFISMLEFAENRLREGWSSTEENNKTADEMIAKALKHKDELV